MADDEAVSVCLICKDPHAQYKDAVKQLGIKSVTKVIGVSKLRTEFKAFEARRQLCGAYDIFLADERVLPMLPKLLGKSFFEKKKIPLPVDLTKTKPEAIKKELTAAIEGTALFLGAGPCTSVKIGVTSQSLKDLQANAQTVIEQVVKKIPGGWKNIRSIHAKTATSVSLPVYAPAAHSE